MEFSDVNFTDRVLSVGYLSLIITYTTTLVLTLILVHHLLSSPLLHHEIFDRKAVYRPGITFAFTKDDDV